MHCTFNVEQRYSSIISGVEYAYRFILMIFITFPYRSQIHVLILRRILLVRMILCEIAIQKFAICLTYKYVICTCIFIDRKAIGYLKFYIHLDFHLSKAHSIYSYSILLKIRSIYTEIKVMQIFRQNKLTICMHLTH